MRSYNFRIFLVVFSSLFATAFIFSGTASAERWSIGTDEQTLSASLTRGLDLDGLEQRLRRSEALGIFVKLALKDRLDTLISDFVLFHEGHRGNSRKSLKTRFDGLLKDTVAMLRNGDPVLSASIKRAHQGLWLIVSDPVRFSAISGQRTAWQEDGRADWQSDIGG